MGSMAESRKFDISQQWPTPHLNQTLKSWTRLQKHLKSHSLAIDGQLLDVASVVAVSRYGPWLSFFQERLLIS